MSTAKPKKVMDNKSGRHCEHRQGTSSAHTELTMSNENNKFQRSTCGTDVFSLLDSSEGQSVEQLIRSILSDSNNINELRKLGLLVDQNSSNRGNPPTGDLSRQEVIRPRDLPLATGLSRTTCWRLSKDPKSGFPPKIRLSAGAVGYSKKAISDWLKSREEV